MTARETTFVPRPRDGLSRRSFLRRAGLYTGVGGMGAGHVDNFKGDTLAAFCDVDDARAAGRYKNFPDVPRFKDFRVMLDKLGDSIDAVAVGAPDHTHFQVAMAAAAVPALFRNTRPGEPDPDFRPLLLAFAVFALLRLVVCAAGRHTRRVPGEKP